jgi:hypothetical protein
MVLHLTKNGAMKEPINRLPVANIYRLKDTAG